jgi:hypothetical protein
MYDDLKWTVDMELDESILVWHIATYRMLRLKRPGGRLAARELSFYMFFLLAVRPYMLPYPVSRQRYVQLCYDFITSGLLPRRVSGNTTVGRGYQLADYLVSKRLDDVAPIVLDVWVEMLCYTAYRCNENSHAKHLSNGGEIMTAVSLLMLYMSNGMIETRAS